ncbi:MAG: hypothetical protein QN187_03560 [Armatimonadota bacterium]|nr:hypothetical protein [Armatimonadota bacterium]MDR7518965.1 hypothetical protein [Armatimonadota bacterium]MDR7548564.1 hypothetical protein [Armatimonadota bacterium]
MSTRVVLVCCCAVAAVGLAGCRPQERGETPTAAQILPLLPPGTAINEIAYADLTGDGRDEVLVAATVPASAAHAGRDRVPTAFVFGVGPGGRLERLFQRRLAGETWEPIQIGRPSDDAPAAAVFAARGGSAGFLGYIVVQQRRRQVQVTAENHGLQAGRIRFIPEGLLETRSDIDRVYRWSQAGWQAEDLSSQYTPPLPAGTVTIEYFVDGVRGPWVVGGRSFRARVGQHLFLHRGDHGQPSRIVVAAGGASYEVTPEGMIRLLQADTLEIHIESPAYSGKTATITVSVEP